eukprot:TRINITY_DN18428_c0_g1_i1.p1 TRINITY_DN18428_c0_g1~~TRINITY_DN18428_c0_g1_i1.p1  ORF type:complete len:1215 (-),score=254.82 TRINITY_DN18428_c0_g1_i1:49-3525(-)
MVGKSMGQPDGNRLLVGKKVLVARPASAGSLLPIKEGYASSRARGLDHDRPATAQGIPSPPEAGHTIARPVSRDRSIERPPSSPQVLPGSSDPWIEPNLEMPPRPPTLTDCPGIASSAENSADDGLFFSRHQTPADPAAPTAPTTPATPVSPKSHGFVEIKNKIRGKKPQLDISANNEELVLEGSLRQKLQTIVAAPRFEFAFALLILLNTLVMTFQVQYQGLDNGNKISYYGMTSPASQVWPGAEVGFLVVEWIFGLIFTAEIILKFIAVDIRFFCDAWNVLDLIVVFAWFIDTVLGGGVIPIPPMLLRLLRLVKLLRMLRLLRTLQGFDALYIMVTSIKGSFAALGWSITVLACLMMMIALFISTMVEGFINDTGQPFDRRMAIFKYYGSFTRSMLTLMELTLANWIPASRALTEYVSEWYLIFVLTFKATIGFSVVKVIMGVFMQVTFYVAANDDVVMMNSRERAVKTHTKKMTALFKAADENGDGRLDAEEFTKIINDPIVVNWLAAMGFEAGHIKGKDLFKLIDTDGGGDLDASEMIRGVAGLKGPASSLGMVCLMKDTEICKRDLKNIAYSVESHLASMGLAEPPPEPEESEKEEDEEEDELAGPDEKKDPVGRVSSMLFNGSPMRGSQKRESHSSAGAPQETDARISGFQNARLQLADFVEGGTFELFFAGLIIACTVVMAFQTQYRGFQNGYDLEHGEGGQVAEYPLTAAEAWPGADVGFVICDYFFGVMFTIEVTLKLLVSGYHFFKAFWNDLDLLVVGFWYVELFSSAALPLDPMLLRLFRLVRLLRMVKLMKMAQEYDQLYLMMTSIKASLAALAWSSLLLILLQVMFSLFLVTVFETYLLNEEETEKSHEVYKYYGTFTRSMLTLFELTLGNWIPVTRTMMTNVSVAYVIFALIHKLFVGFAVVMVVTGVFVQETVKVAQTDNTIMLNQRERAARLHVKKMTALFSVADADGSGRLDKDEWLEVCSDPSVKMWLSAMGLDVSDAGRIHDLICEGSGEDDLSAKELVMGISRLKGGARNTDMALMRLELAKVVQTLQRLNGRMPLLQGAKARKLSESKVSEFAEKRAELEKVNAELTELEGLEGRISLQEALRLQRSLLQKKSELQQGLPEYTEPSRADELMVTKSVTADTMQTTSEQFDRVPGTDF